MKTLFNTREIKAEQYKDKHRKKKEKNNTNKHKTVGPNKGHACII